MRSFKERATLAALAVLILALSIASVRLDTATSDEPAYLAAGFIKLVHGRLDFFRDQPPLMNSISVIPLVLAGYELKPVWKIASNPWEVGRYLLYRSGYDANRMLFLARLPTVALFLSLCFVVYWFVARETGSRWWGIAAFALVGLCPNVMAHGRLATVDVALAFFSFVAAILFIIVIEKHSVAAAIGMGMASACAVMSKTSGNIIGPFFIVVLVVAFLMKRVSNPRRVLMLFAVAVISAVAFAEVFILAEAAPSYIADSFPGKPKLLVPFLEYRTNIQLINRWYTQGHEFPQFLMGEFSTRGWRHYYLVAILLKTTIPALLLVLFGVVAFLRRMKQSFPAVILFLYAAIFLAVASKGDLALGIRYVLVIYPFVYAAVAITLAHATRELDARKKRLVSGTVVALLVWHSAENVAAYPNYIGYFNEFIGGSANADKFLIDSNLDWGTDLRRLQQWSSENGVKEIAIHYFGGGDPAWEFRNGPRAIVLYDIPAGGLPKGWFALSRHWERLSYDANTFPVDYGTLLERANARYVTTIGHSINVYRVE